MIKMAPLTKVVTVCVQNILTVSPASYLCANLSVNLEVVNTIYYKY